jgi:formylglycine-generating enzyme required for sulfatase activity
MRREDWSSYSISVWERLITLDEEELRELIAKQEADRPRDRPAYWDDERFSNPSQPVVGVTWFEARAYCAWLEARWRSVDSGCRSVRLPTEAEWEKAARTPANGRYPWGKHWASECANTVEGHLLRTTPVGIYPGGATALGVHDLSGNVWEWTLSLYRPYRYQPGDGRNDPEAEGQRVVRGGSWGGGRGDARCAYRGRVRPDDFGGGLGFRGVVSLANSEC